MQHLTRTQRVHALIRLLSRQAYTVEVLADIFGVSTRQINRDLVLIQADPFWCIVTRETMVRVSE